MTFEEKIQWLDGLLVDLSTARNAYRHALAVLKAKENDPPGIPELESFLTDHVASILAAAAVLDTMLVSVRMARLRLESPQVNTPFVPGVLS